MARLKHTDAKHGGFSQGGESYLPDKKGVIEVPDHMIDEAFAHGFSLIAADEPDEKLEKPVTATTLKK